MSPIAAALIVVSALLHAVWNLLSKWRCPSPAFFLVANAAAAVCLIPVLVYFRDALLVVPGSVWLLLAATGFFQALYFIGLGRGYQSGDMSVVYPMARALPVLFVYLGTLAVGKGREVGLAGAVGMVLVAVGCLLLPVKRLGDLRLSKTGTGLGRSYTRACCVFALVAAVGTSGYSMIDDEALRRLREVDAMSGRPLRPAADRTCRPAETGLRRAQSSRGGGCAPEPLVTATLRSTVLYIALESILTCAWLACVVLLRASGRRGLVTVAKGFAPQAVVTGLVMCGTYALVLASMAFVENVSYVVAFRQLSIPLGAILGMVALGEPRYTPKLVGVTVASVGLVLVGLG